MKLRARTRTWDDVDISEMLDFWVGWRPPVGEFTRSRSSWQTWEEYLNDWAAVRAEGLADWEARRAEGRTHARTEVARRAERLEQADTDFGRELHAGLLADAEEWLEKEESKELPFAERVYQRVLAGEAPDASYDENDD